MQRDHEVKCIRCHCVSDVFIDAKIADDVVWMCDECAVVMFNQPDQTDFFVEDPRDL